MRNILLVSFDIIQPAKGGKVKENLVVSHSDKSSNSSVILDEPSDKKQNSQCKGYRPKVTEKSLFRAFSNDVFP